MLPRMDAGTAPLAPAKTARPADGPGSASQAQFQSALQPMLGKAMQGNVLARLTDGSFIVRVAGQAARMMLPAGAQVGADVPLTLVAINPRPTFQVGNSRDPAASATLTYADATTELETKADTGAATAAQTGARATSLGATLLGKAMLTPASLLPGFDASAPAPELSKAGRAITSILTQAESAPGAPTSITGKAPLGVPPAMDTTQLAQNLHDSVGNSGLFYESHVAEWAEGKRPLATLMNEPQMQRALQGEMTRVMQGTDLASAQFINLQLLTHEQGRVVWQGEAWPGQQMEWQINKDGQSGQPNDDRQAGSDEQAWRSGVRFRFPLLGDVSASVVLVGGRVHIQMQAGSADSAAVLRSNSGALERSLEAAGAPLSSLTISAPEAAPPATPEAGDAD